MDCGRILVKDVVVQHHQSHYHCQQEVLQVLLENRQLSDKLRNYFCDKVPTLKSMLPHAPDFDQKSSCVVLACMIIHQDYQLFSILEFSEDAPLLANPQILQRLLDECNEIAK